MKKSVRLTWYRTDDARVGRTHPMSTSRMGDQRFNTGTMPTRFPINHHQPLAFTRKPTVPPIPRSPAGCGINVCTACTSHVNGKAFNPCSVKVKSLGPDDEDAVPTHPREARTRDAILPSPKGRSRAPRDAFVTSARRRRHRRNQGHRPWIDPMVRRANL